MIITDLNHLEVISEEKDLIGGLSLSDRRGRTIFLPSTATALAGATADTIANLKAETLTETVANAVPGLFSSSKSVSLASGISL